MPQIFLCPQSCYCKKHFKHKLLESAGESEEDFSALVVCPNCGKEVAAAVKSWPVSFKKQETQEASPQFYESLFECPKCKTKFRAKTDAAGEPLKTINIKDAVEKIRIIREGLMQTLKALREKLSALETERSGLLAEIEEMKCAAESRADALEDEVNQLREEVRSLREFFGSAE
jgi:hypothetical protein